MQQTVRLLDDLGVRYGSEHVYFNLRSPAEAIKLLCINHPALQKELTEAHQHGVGYTLVQAGTFLGYEDLQLPLGKNDLVLAPVIAGSGGSTTQILAGVGLVAASFLLPGAGLFGTTSIFGISAAGATAPLVAGSVFGTALGTAISSIGASLVLGGVSQMLSPQPTVPRTAPGEITNATGPQGVSRALSGRQSYAFTGPANTVGVGATVPLVYGKLLIGSHLLSSTVDVTNESDPTGEFFSIPGVNSVTINGGKPGYKFQSFNGLRTRRWETPQVTLDSDSGDDARKTSPNTVIRFDQTENRRSAEVVSFEAEGSSRRKNLQILFKLEGGLFNVIAGQMVPAFVTYEIKIAKDNYDEDNDPTAAVARGTIQGLLRRTEPYNFAHALVYAKLGGEDSDTTVRLNVRIIDTDAEDSGGKLIVRGYGYNHFRDDSENNTHDLTEL